jgi:hypothetical protein
MSRLVNPKNIVIRSITCVVSLGRTTFTFWGVFEEGTWEDKITNNRYVKGGC